MYLAFSYSVRKVNKKDDIRAQISRNKFKIGLKAGTQRGFKISLMTEILLPGREAWNDEIFDLKKLARITYRDISKFPLISELVSRLKRIHDIFSNVTGMN